MTISNERFEGATHITRLGGAFRYFSADDFEEATRQVVEASGLKGVPEVEKLSTNGGNGGNGGTAPSSPTNAAPVQRGEGHVDTAGAARSLVDKAALEASGFAPKQPYFERGTRVIEYGVEEAKRLRAEFDAMPTAEENAKELISTIDAEARSEEVVELSGVRMNNNGDLRLRSGGPRIPPNGRSFGSLLSRAGIGGARYLTEHCWPELRAINWNRQADRIAEAEKESRRIWAQDVSNQIHVGHTRAKAEKIVGSEPEPQRIKFLTRRNARHPSGREVYGAVGPKFPADFSVRLIAEAVAKAAPEGSRGEVSYDGQRARFRILLHSTVQPEDYVAGEFFRVGIGVRTDDTGGGSCVVDALFWQNLCLNLVCIDEGITGIARIRHVGSVDKLAAKLEKAIQKAWASLSHFQRAWGYGTHEDVLARTIEVTHDEDAKRHLQAAQSGGVRIEDVLPGLFNGIIERELVPVKGRRVETIPKLVEAYGEDVSAAKDRSDTPLSRTAVVNAFTRFAHTTNSDPWAQDDIQTGAGSLLFGKRRKNGTFGEPAPLPYIPLSV